MDYRGAISNGFLYHSELLRRTYIGSLQIVFYGGDTTAICYDSWYANNLQSHWEKNEMADKISKIAEKSTVPQVLFFLLFVHGSMKSTGRQPRENKWL